MDDLISRKAAIDEIKGFQQGAAEWRDEQQEGSDIWHRADSAIASALEIGLRVKKLPSAQQRGTVVTCDIDKCKHNDDGLCKAEFIYLSEDHACDGGCDDGWVFDEKEELKIKGEES